MKNIKIPVLALVLCLCVAMALLITGALAADDSLEVSITSPTGGSGYEYGAELTVQVTPQLTEGSSLSAGTVTFTVNSTQVSGVSISVPAESASATPLTTANIKISSTNGFKKSENTITATYTETGGSGTTITGTTYINVTPKELTLEWTGADGLTYDGDAKAPTAQISDSTPLVSGDNDNVEVKVSVKGGTTGQLTGAEAINAGDYTATAELDGDAKDYYSIAEGSDTQPFTISPATIQDTDITAPTLAASPLTYNGNAQSLLAPGGNGSATGGTIQYFVGEKADSAKWTDAEAIKETDAGSYQVWYKVEPDENHTYTGDAASGKSLGTVIISPATIDFTYSQESATYTGRSLADKVTVTQTADSTPRIVAGSYTVSFKQNAGRVPEPKDAGTYDVYVMITVNNFQFSEGAKEKKVGTFTIDPADSEVTSAPTKNTLTYTGQEQSLVSAGTPSGGDMQYYVGSTAPTTEEAWSTDIPKGKDATTYTVWYRVKGDANHNDTVAQSISAAIKQKEVTLTWKLDGASTDNFTITYDGKSHTVTAEAETGVGSEKVNVTVTGGQQTAANESAYTAIATVLTAGDGSTNADNYTLPSEKTKTFTISKATPTVAVTSAGPFTYGDTITLTAEVSSGSIAADNITGDVTFKANGTELGKGTKSGNTWTLTIEGTDTTNQKALFDNNTKITAEYSGNNNISEKTSSTASVTVEKKELTFTFAPEQKTYDGNNTVTGTLSRLNGLVGTDSVTANYTATADSMDVADSVNVTVNVTLTGTDVNYYKAQNPSNVTVKIVPADITSVTAPTAATGLEYNGQDRQLIASEGSFSAVGDGGGTMKYYVGDTAPAADTEDWKTNINEITGKDAKTYQVWYYVDGDNNHNDTEPAQIVGGVEIAKKEVSLTWQLGDSTDDFTITYDGKAHTVTATVNTGVDGETLTATMSENQKTDAGTYTATVTKLENGADGKGMASNYKLPSTGTSQSYTIKKATVSVSPEVTETVTYDAKPHTVATVTLNTGSATALTQGDDYTVKYRASTDGEGNTTAVDSETEVGTYGVWVELTSTTATKNYEFADSTQKSKVGTLTIEEAPLKLTVDAVTITYGQKLSDFTLSGKATIDDGTEITGIWEWNDGTVTPAVSDSQNTTYKVKFTPTEKNANNFTEESLSTEITITVNKAKLTPSIASVVSKEQFDGKTDTTGAIKLTGAKFDQSPEATGTFNFDTPTAGESKKVTVTNITLGEDWTANYELTTTTLTSVSTSAKIGKRVVVLSWDMDRDSEEAADFTTIYNGSAVSVTATVTNHVASYPVTVSTYTDNDGKDAGSYTAIATGLSDPDNYVLPSDGTERQEYTINKSVVTFEEHDGEIIYDTKPHQVELTNKVTGGALELQDTDYEVHYAATGENFDTGKTDETNVGEYDVWVRLTDEAFKNYMFGGDVQQSKVGNLTVKQTELELTIPEITITYGDELADELLTHSEAKIKDSQTTIEGTWAWELTDDTYPQVSDSDETGYTVVFTPAEPYRGNFTSESLEKTVNITVNKAKLTPSIATVESKAQFDGKTDTTGTLTLTGAVLNESPTATGTFNFDDAKAGDNKPVTVTGIALSDSWGDNYELTTNKLESQPTSAKIGKRVVTLEWKLNDGDTFTVDYTSKPVSVTATVTNQVTQGEGVSADYSCTVTVTNGDKTNAGTYTAVATGLSDSDNYTLPTDGTEQKEYTISPAKVSFEIGGEVKATWPTTEANADPNPTGYSIKGSGTAYDLSMTYDSYTHKANVTQTTGGVTIPEGGFTVTYKKQGDDAAELTEIRNAGKYDIYVNLKPVEGTETYNFVFDGQEATVHSLKIGTITVEPYAVTVTWTHTSYVYHGHVMHPIITVQNAFKSDKVYDTSKGLPTGFNTGSPDSYTGNALVAFAATSDSKVGTYEVTAQLYGRNAGNYTISNNTATVNIVAAPVSFTVGDNIWIVGQTEGKTVTLRPVWGEVTTEPDPDVAANHQYPAAGTKIDQSLLNDSNDVNITYKKGDDVFTEEAPPTEAGTYEIWVEITNENFHHASRTNGKSHNVGKLVIAASESDVTTYTVTFDANEGEGTAPAQMTGVLSGQTVVLPGQSGVNPGVGGTEYGLTREGYVFRGWTYDGVIYQPNEEFHMPAGDVTFKAEWQEKREISGTVKQYTDADKSDSNPVNGATVILKQGATAVKETVSGEDGSFSFTDLAPGIYNLEIRYSNNGGAEIVKTVMVDITTDNWTGGDGDDCILPSGALNTVVEVGSGITAVVDMEAITSEDESGEEGIYTTEDKQTVADGGSVQFDMKVEATEVAPEKIEELPVSSDRIGMTLDLKLTKTVTDQHGAEVTERSGNITDSKQLIVTLVHLPAELQGKTSYTIYRFHVNDDGEEEMQTITTSVNKDGEYLKIVREGTAIEIHARYYSTYVLTWYQSPGIITYRIDLPTETRHGKVTSNLAHAIIGSRVTLTVTIDEGCDLRSLAVTTGNGDPVELTDNGDGTYTFTMPSGAVTVSAEFAKCPSLDFPDLNVSDWYHPYTDYVIENGLMNGTDANTFAPYATTTRAQLVTILYRLEGEPDVTKDVKFSDVPAGQWFSNAINWAAANGIVDGYGNGEFGPNNTITREQMAAILYRYATLKGYDVSGQADLTGYTDAGSVNDWADRAMRWAVAEGIIQGTGTTTLDPSGVSIRVQVATILTRFRESISE